jgi:hypothetical protein
MAVLSTSSLFTGILAVFSPVPFARTFGVEADVLTKSSENPTSPYILLFGGRKMTLGLALWALWYQGMDRALGTLMCCVVVGGVVDVFVTGKYGVKWFSHAVGTVAFGVVGALLLR